MITVRYSYTCDACGCVAVGDDVYCKRADDGAVQGPRTLRLVGHMHVCEGCFRVAERAVAEAQPRVLAR